MSPHGHRVGNPPLFTPLFPRIENPIPRVKPRPPIPPRPPMPPRIPPRTAHDGPP